MNNTPQQLPPDAKFGAAAAYTISRLHDQMMKNLPGTISGEDIEALHDMRVASRRLRSALRIFDPCLPRKKLKLATKLVKGVTQALGQVRDQDVFLDYLEKAASEQTEIEFGWIIDQEKTEREKLRVKMIKTLLKLNKNALSKALLDLCDSASKPSPKRRKICESLFASQAPEQVNERLVELEAISGAINDPNDINGLHGMRIAAKRLRYTLEAFIPCFGEPLEKLINEVKNIQEELGVLHDCDVWIPRLERYKEYSNDSHERTISVDYLIEDRTKRREKAYKDALKQWQKMQRIDFKNTLINIVNATPEKIALNNKNKNGALKIESSCN